MELDAFDKWCVGCSRFFFSPHYPISTYHAHTESWRRAFYLSDAHEKVAPNEVPITQNMIILIKWSDQRNSIIKIRFVPDVTTYRFSNNKHDNEIIMNTLPTIRDFDLFLHKKVQMIVFLSPGASHQYWLKTNGDETKLLCGKEWKEKNLRWTWPPNLYLIMPFGKYNISNNNNNKKKK